MEQKNSKGGKCTYLGRGKSGIYALEIEKDGNRSIKFVGKQDILEHKSLIRNLKVQQSNQIQRANRLQAEQVALLIDTICEREQTKETAQATSKVSQSAEPNRFKNLEVVNRTIMEYNSLMRYVSKYETFKRATGDVCGFACQQGVLTYQEYLWNHPGYLELIKLSGNQAYIKELLRDQVNHVVMVYKAVHAQYFRDLDKTPNQLIYKPYRRLGDADEDRQKTVLSRKDIGEFQIKNLKTLQSAFKENSRILRIAEHMATQVQKASEFAGTVELETKAFNTVDQAGQNLKAKMQDNDIEKEVLKHSTDRNKDKQPYELLFENKANTGYNKKVLGLNNPIFGAFDGYDAWISTVFKDITIDDFDRVEMQILVQQLNYIFFRIQTISNLQPFDRGGVTLEKTVEDLLFMSLILAYQQNTSDKCYVYYITLQLFILGWFITRRVLIQLKDCKTLNKKEYDRICSDGVPDLSEQSAFKILELACLSVGLDAQDFMLAYKSNYRVILKENKRQLKKARKDSDN